MLYYAGVLRMRNYFCSRKGDYLSTLRKIKLLVISFVMCIVVCAGVIPFASATYTERDKIIDIASSEIGYTQKNGYNKFSAEFGNGYTAWCNYFVVWCAKQAGVSPKAITGTSSYNGNCYIYMNALRNQGRFFENDGSYTPKKGDLVFYNSSKSTSGSTHIGFVVSADKNTVTTIEGNVTVKGTRGVGKNVRPRYSYVGNMIIIGFGVPAYSGEEVPKAPIKKNTDNYVPRRTNRVSIDVTKFETHVSVEERIRLSETIKTAEISTTFVSAFDAADIKKMECDTVCILLNHNKQLINL